MIRVFYVPCADKKSAQKMAKTLLKENLIFCANIISGMQSVYRWKNKITSSKEVVLIVKTLAKGKKLARRIEELHSYDVPCVLELPTIGINKKYLQWAKEQNGK
ncbi:MAG: divalent-cation tolerance protein CutA [Pseudobdellovibrionaceae bacterium]